MIDKDYESMLQAQSEAAEASFRASQNARQKWVFLLVMLPALILTVWLATLAIRRTWQNATTGPSERVHEAPRPGNRPSELAPGAVRLNKEGAIERFSW